MRRPVAISAALPDEALRPLVLVLLNGTNAAPTTLPAAQTSQPAPKKRRGWPKGKPRGPRKAAIAKPGKDADRLIEAESAAAAAADSKHTDRLARRRRREAEQRRARRAAAQGKASNGAEVTPEVLWKHAESLAPGKPWRAVMREFGINEAVAVDCYRNKTIPPGIVPSAITHFLDCR